jgi:hypothetical protein
MRLTVQIEVNLHDRSMCCGDHGLEQLSRCDWNFRPLSPKTKSEGVHNPELYIISGVNRRDWVKEILTCHIKGTFLRLPTTRRRTSNLHIVIKDHI